MLCLWHKPQPDNHVLARGVIASCVVIQSILLTSHQMSDKETAAGRSLLARVLRSVLDSSCGASFPANAFPYQTLRNQIKEKWVSGRLAFSPTSYPLCKRRLACREAAVWGPDNAVWHAYADYSKYVELHRKAWCFVTKVRHSSQKPHKHKSSCLKDKSGEKNNCNITSKKRHSNKCIALYCFCIHSSFNQTDMLCVEY